jgi:cellulose synthase/poly-beta-1,6-N-acetylglucosamine synthase-like glycosyltransferase
MAAWLPQLLLAALVLLMAWPVVLYPLFLKLFPPARPTQPPFGGDPGGLPDVALIICALNEAGVMEQKIGNALELAYPAGRLHVVVVNDGSTDATGAIADRFAPRIEVIHRAERRGKVSNLNDVIAARTEPIVALSDANVLYHRDALLHLVSCFTDTAVGAASGRVELVETTDALKGGEGSYYSLEWFLQDAASRLHSMCGADGAMYALRRELFTPCPADTIIEDFVLPMAIVRRGYRVVFTPHARAFECGVQSLREEYRRKVRIAAGAAQCLLRGNGIPWGGPAAMWFIWTSHKLLRWLSPAVALGAVVIAATKPTLLLPILVLGGTGLLVCTALLRLAGLRGKFFDVPFYYLFNQVAVLHGLLRGLTGTQAVMWKKESR